MDATNASGGAPAAAEQYSTPTWDKQAEPGYAVLALAGDVELTPGSQLVFVGLVAGKTRQVEMAPAARARLVALGWSDEDARGARFVSFRPAHARTTPGLPEPSAAVEPAPEPVDAAGAAAAAGAPDAAAPAQSARKRRARGGAVATDA